MKLIAIDMDGTLLNDSKGISIENKKSINDAVKQGHIVMICSGRTYEDVLSLLEEKGLDMPICGSNGTVVYADKKVIHTTPMNLSAAKKAFLELEKQKHPFKVYTNKGIFSIQDFLDRARKEFDNNEKHSLNFDLLIEYQKKINVVPISSFSEIESLDNIEVHKFFIFAPDQERKEKAISALKQIETLSITSSGEDNIEVMDVHGNKGIGLKVMANYFNIPMKDTVAIGDNFNDVPMLEVAGLSIAMENGEDDVKKSCDVVTLSNEDNGVAHAIYNYIIKK